MNELDPDQYVQENADQLTYVIKHSNDRFVRSLCLAALVEYGTDGELEEIERDLERIRTENGSLKSERASQ